MRFLRIANENCQFLATNHAVLVKVGIISLCFLAHSTSILEILCNFVMRIITLIVENDQLIIIKTNQNNVLVK